MEGFRKQVLRRATSGIENTIFGILALVALIVWLVALIALWLLIPLLFIPEVIIAFIVALFRDKWQMWANPFLRRALKSFLDRSPI